MRNEKIVKVFIEVEVEVNCWVQPFRAEKLNEPEEPYDVVVQSVLLRSECGKVKTWITSCVDKDAVKQLAIDELNYDDRGNEP